MSGINNEILLEEISPESPCGDNLEYEAEFVEMENSSKGKVAEYSGKDEISAAEPPDWRRVLELSTSILQKSKDLRAAVLLTRSLTAIKGLAGMSEGLELITGLVMQYWDIMHPQLDPDDDNDPTLRVNILNSLAANDGMITELKHAIVIEFPPIGKFNLHDIHIAMGKSSASDDDQVLDINLFDAACREVALHEIISTLTSVQNSLDYVRKIEATLNEKIGIANSPEFSPLLSMLKEIEDIFTEKVAIRDDTIDSSKTIGNDHYQAVESSSNGTISGREDVVRMLDMICEYYKKHEPSSPIPLLLQRARSLVTKDFMEIIEDLVPDGVSQAQVLKGHKNNDGN